MNRMFFALWPDDISRQRCIGIINSVRQDSSKPVQSANLHVTLVFLGNITETQQYALQVAASEITVPELVIHFDRLSFWKKPGILCLTASKPCPHLSRLADNLTQLAKSLKIQIDERPYKPHITLVRNTGNVSGLCFEPIVWHSHSFCLAQSTKMPDNTSQYEIIQQWPVPGLSL